MLRTGTNANIRNVLKRVNTRSFCTPKHIKPSDHKTIGNVPQHVKTNSSSNWIKTILLGSAIGLLGTSYLYHAKENNKEENDQKNEEDKEEEEEEIVPGEYDEKLPDFTKEEVSKHNNPNDGYWVTFRHGVYDITEFIESHPGGKTRILLAAGNSIEPYWKIYRQHRAEDVYEILEGLRIGNLSDYEEIQKSDELDEDNPFANEPERSPLLTVNSQQPFNAETPLVLLAEHFITPTPLFFVRNHLPVPLIDPETYSLDIIVDKKSENKKSYSLEDLKNNFKHHTITATIQCAGNRRDDFNQYENVKGLTWRGGAIGNGTWTGVLLRDVLLDSGFDVNSENIINLHCLFQGLDGDGAGTFYEASVPLRKAIDQFGDVLLAFEMNGEELSRDHGFPIRAVVPGHVGARNVKWLTKIEISDEESHSHWQRKDYKSFSPAVNWNNINWDSATSIQELPVQSLICHPPPGSVFASDVDEIELTGYAWSGGGRNVIRVDINVDGQWHEGELLDPDEDSDLHFAPNRNWSWRLWKASIPIPADKKGKINVYCRAVDESYNTQPQCAGSIWNVRGVNNNSCHSVEFLKE